MSAERLSPAESQYFSKLWIGISEIEVNEARKKEMKSLRTTLSPTAINRLFPEPKGDDSPYPHYAPFITTPEMLEQFVEKWDPKWRDKSDFSLMPALQELFQALKNVEGEPHIIYAELRGLYRIFMLQNLLQSDWRPEREDSEIETRQTAKDKELKGRVKRLADYADSDTWRYFSDAGYENWKIAQAEVLAFLETKDSDWRKVFKHTQRELRPR